MGCNLLPYLSWVLSVVRGCCGCPDRRFAGETPACAVADRVAGGILRRSESEDVMASCAAIASRLATRRARRPSQGNASLEIPNVRDGRRYVTGIAWCRAGA
jgi:hypothetical protein